MTDEAAVDRHRALVLLRSSGGGGRDSRSADLTAIAAGVGGAGDPDAVVRLWTQVPDDPLADAFAGEPFDSVIDIETTRGPERLIALLSRLDLDTSSFDRDRSVVVAGQVHQLDAGDGPLGLFFCMKPKDGMSVEQFHTYWRHEHAVHHAHRDGTGYHQLHATHALSASAADATGVAPSGLSGVAIAVIGAPPPAGGGRVDRGDRENFVDPVTEIGIIVERVA